MSRNRLLPTLGVLALVLLALPALADEFSNARNSLKRTLADPAASSQQKAQAIRALGKFGSGRSAKKAVKELFNILKDKGLMKPRQVRQLEMDLEKTKRDYETLLKKVQISPGRLQFTSTDEKTKYYELQKQIKVLEDRLTSNSVAKNAVVDALSQMRETEGRIELKKGLSNRDEDIQGACLEAIRRQRWTAAFDSVVETYRSARSAGVRGLAVATLRALDARRAQSIMLEAIKDSSWLARSHAVAALRQVRDVKSIEAIIAALGREGPGRLKWDMVEALRDLTGKKEFGENASAWRSWWAQKKDGFRVPPAVNNPNPGRPGNPGAVDPKARKTGTFYGIPVKGRNPLFIIDKSGSMLWPAKAAPGQQMQGKQPPPLQAGQKTKWAVCQDQLVKVLTGLPEGATFGLVWFSTTVDTYKKGAMLKATASEKRAVESAVRAMNANGLTNIYGAFQKGFEMVRGGPGGRSGPVFTDGKGKLAVDEIFFLTDGSPTVGESINGVAPTNPPNREYSPLLLEEICKWNQSYNLVINCIGIGQCDTNFLSQLAQRNRGIFKHVTE